MGLELGPPWLILAMDNGSHEAEILLQDNFTGAAMQRITKARKQEPGSFAAAMAKDGRFALHPDGTRYDPLEETKGRKGGTASERGHRAYVTAKALFRQMNGMSWEEAAAPPNHPLDKLSKAMFWIAGLLVVVALIAML